MIAIGATIIATLGCEGCTHVGANYAAPSVPVHIYEVPRAVPTTEAVQPNLSYDGRFEKTEIIPGTGFVGTEAFVGPIDVRDEDKLSSLRLYSSSTLAGVAGEREQSNLSSIPREVRNLTAEMSLSASSEQTGLGFDVGVSPRLSYSREGDIATRRIGGEVRIGQNFDKRGEADGADGWYLFAGADGEALVFAPGEEGGLLPSNMALRDKVTVGDMQAGLTFLQGPGQVSFSYIQREVEYSERNIGGNDSEQFAGVTFTIRR